MPSNYDALRQAQREALEQQRQQQLTEPVEEIGRPLQEPSRPANHPSESKTPRWPMEQGLDRQQAAASKWAKAANEQMEADRAVEQRREGKQRGDGLGQPDQVGTAETRPAGGVDSRPNEQIERERQDRQSDRSNQDEIARASAPLRSGRADRMGASVEVTERMQRLLGGAGRSDRDKDRSDDPGQDRQHESRDGGRGRSR